MTPLDLNELRRLHAAAPDHIDTFRDRWHQTVAALDCKAFYEATHDALPELLDELERLRAALHGTTCSGGCDVPACWTKEVEP